MLIKDCQNVEADRALYLKSQRTRKPVRQILLSHRVIQILAYVYRLDLLKRASHEERARPLDLEIFPPQSSEGSADLQNGSLEQGQLPSLHRRQEQPRCHRPHGDRLLPCRIQRKPHHAQIHRFRRRASHLPLQQEILQMPARKEVSGLRRLLHHLRELIVQDKIARGQTVQQLRHRQWPLRNQRLQSRHAARHKREGSGAR